MPLDLSRAGHDPGDPALEPMLADLQGNILKSYGRNGTVLLLIRFLGNDPAAARRWIQGFARAFVTTARIQEQQSAAFKWSRQPTLGGLFANVFLTARGYLALGIPDEQVPRDLQAFFNRGMPVRQGALRDPKIESWQAEFQRAIDAMASLASDDVAELHRHAAAVQAELSGIAAEVWAETGSRVYRKLEQNVIGFDRAIEALARTIKATPERWREPMRSAASRTVRRSSSETGPRARTRPRTTSTIPAILTPAAARSTPIRGRRIRAAIPAPCSRRECRSRRNGAIGSSAARSISAGPRTSESRPWGFTSSVSRRTSACNSSSSRPSGPARSGSSSRKQAPTPSSARGTTCRRGRSGPIGGAIPAPARPACR